jgi:hypothetical protein
MKTYTVGEITLTQQAFIVFIIQAIVALSALFLFKSNIKLAIGIFVGTLAFGAYATYLTNCTVVGKCQKLAWVLVALNTITAALVIPMRLKMLKNGK